MSFLLGTLLHAVQDSVIKVLRGVSHMFWRLAVLLLTSAVVLWLSVFLYAAFYYSYMPAVSHVRPVHFQFESCNDRSGSCSYLTANVTLTKRGFDRLLMRGQEYRVYLDLELPESPTNKELGMFMVRIDFLSRNSEVVQSSSRSAMLHYKSSLLHTINTLFHAPFLIWGIIEEKQTVNVELYDYYEDDPRKPAVKAHIELQRIRYLMFHWPIFSAIIGISTNLFFLTTIALLSWYRYVSGRKDSHVVVRIGVEDNPKAIEERRKQAREILIRERQRQSSIKEKGFRLRSRSQSPAAMQRRTHSFEQLVLPDRAHDSHSFVEGKTTKGSLEVKSKDEVEKPLITDAKETKLD